MFATFTFRESGILKAHYRPHLEAPPHAASKSVRSWFPFQCHRCLIKGNLEQAQQYMERQQLSLFDNVSPAVLSSVTLCNIRNHAKSPSTSPLRDGNKTRVIKPTRKTL